MNPTRPADMSGPEAFGHGTRARYITGCRCEPCRVANAVYARGRYRSRRLNDDWNGLVPAEDARKHLRALSRAGVGRRAVAAAADIPESTVFAVASGKKTRIRAKTERRLLGVDAGARADHSIIPAKRTWRLISKLLEEGFSKAELARRLGYRVPALQFRKTAVTALNAHRVEKLFRAVME